MPRRQDRPRLTATLVLGWADVYHASNGKWPGHGFRFDRRRPGENWRAVDKALRAGLRGLRGGSSLFRLLVRNRGVRDPRERPRLKIGQILQWADAHHRRSGQWPTFASGSIVDAPNETWARINGALKLGRRGLAGGSSLTRLLAHGAGCGTSLACLPYLISGRSCTGRTLITREPASGPIVFRARSRKPGETWLAVENALREGLEVFRAAHPLFSCSSKNAGYGTAAARRT